MRKLSGTILAKLIMAIFVGGLTLTTVGGFAEDLSINGQQEV